jgi:hypothetical protein
VAEFNALMNDLRIVPPIEPNALLRTPTQADAWSQNTGAVGDWVAQQRAISAERGLWNDETGLPTQAGALDAARQASMNLLLSTSAPGGKGFTAYHGSPHDFPPTPRNPLGEFDPTKIGTGEGAQAYGVGAAYLAEREGIAKGYRDALTKKQSGVMVDGTPAEQASLSPGAVQIAQMHLDGTATMDVLRARNEAALAKAQAGLSSNPNSQLHQMNADAAQRTLAALDELKGKQVSFQPNPGHMYEVQVKADPEHFLHWDKPLSEQHPVVQAALSPERLKVKVKGSPPDAPFYPTEKGREIYEMLGAGDPAKAAAALREAGIPGIRYLDASSRGAPRLSDADRQQLHAAIADKQRLIADPRQQRDIAMHQADLDLFQRRLKEADDVSHNVVVFDAATMEILRKYGLAGLMLGGGAAAAGSQQPQ